MTIWVHPCGFDLAWITIPSDGLLYLLRTFHNGTEQSANIVLPGFLGQALDLGMSGQEAFALATKFTRSWRGFAGLVLQPYSSSKPYCSCNSPALPSDNQETKKSCVLTFTSPESFSFRTKLRAFSLGPARSRSRRGCSSSDSFRRYTEGQAGRRECLVRVRPSPLAYAAARICILTHGGVG